MLKFEKDGNVKLIDPNSQLIPILKEDGWIVEGGKVSDDDRLEKAKKRASELGLKVHHKAKAETIEAQIAEVENGNSTEPD